MSSHDCPAPAPPFTSNFFEYSALLPIVFLCQLLLLFSAIYHECTKPYQPKYQETWLWRRILYFLLQFVGIYWTMNDFVRFIINTRYPITPNDFICTLVAYSPKIIPNVFYGIYLYIILLQLQHSINHSHLQLSRRTFVLFSFLILGFNAIWPLFFLVINGRTPCIYPWNPPDMDDSFKFCDLPIAHEPTPKMLLFVGLGYVALLMIVFAVIFCVKSYKCMISNVGHEVRRFQMRTLILKICMLFGLGITSTTINWILWITKFTSLEKIFLHIDTLVNCLVIGLMFEYNEKYYKRLCKCCIYMAFDKLSREVDQPQNALSLKTYMSSDTVSTNMNSVDENGKDDRDDLESNFSADVIDIKMEKQSWRAPGFGHGGNVQSDSEDVKEMVVQAVFEQLAKDKKQQLPQPQPQQVRQPSTEGMPNGVPMQRMHHSRQSSRSHDSMYESDHDGKDEETVTTPTQGPVTQHANSDQPDDTQLTLDGNTRKEVQLESTTRYEV